MTPIDIYEPVDGRITVRQSKTKDLKAYMERNRTRLPSGTRLYAYVGNSTLHFLLKEGGGAAWWDLERQVVGGRRVDTQ